jgi:diguanylate cyclase (GGDEF)-like protein
MPLRTLRYLSGRNERYLQQETRQQRQKLALMVFLFVGALILLPSAGVDYWLFGQPVLAGVEAFFGVLSVSFFLLFRRYEILPEIVSYLFVAISGIMIWLITTMLRTDMSTLLWAGIFPFIALYLLGIRHGLIAHVAFGVIMVATLVWYPDRIPYPVTTQLLVNFVGIMTAFGVFAFLYEYTNHRANRQWVQYSYTDPLTGLGNRQLFDLLFEKYCADALRHRRSLSLLLVDLDHFKRVNDTYGHVAGDRLLTELSEVMLAVVRKSDTLTRWGGEEFMIIAPDTDAKHARKLAEKLRRTIQTHTFETVGHITASFGITQIDPNDSKESAVRRADEALYRAKANGRNRIEIS